MGRTCGEPGEIELAPIGVELNGPRRVPFTRSGLSCLSMKQCGNIFRVGSFLDFVIPSTRTPHGGYVRGAGRTLIDRHGVRLNGPGRVPDDGHHEAAPQRRNALAPVPVHTEKGGYMSQVVH